MNNTNSSHAHPSAKSAEIGQKPSDRGKPYLAFRERLSGKLCWPELVPIPISTTSTGSVEHEGCHGRPSVTAPLEEMNVPPSSEIFAIIGRLSLVLSRVCR